MDLISSFAKILTPGIVSLILRLDKEAFSPLKPHINKIFCIHINHLSPHYFQIQENNLVPHEVSAEENVNTTFSGPLSAFIGMILNKNIQHGMHIRGDIDCAKALYDAWHNMDLDIEGFLAGYFGDTLAHNLCQGLLRCRQFVKETSDARLNDLGAYLQDEAKLLPTRTEIESFYKAIDMLRHDVERLEAKIRLLQQSQGT